MVSGEGSELEEELIGEQTSWQNLWQINGNHLHSGLHLGTKWATGFYVWYLLPYPRRREQCCLQPFLEL